MSERDAVAVWNSETGEYLSISFVFDVETIGEGDTLDTGLVVVSNDQYANSNSRETKERKKENCRTASLARSYRLVSIFLFLYLKVPPAAASVWIQSITMRNIMHLRWLRSDCNRRPSFRPNSTWWKTCPPSYLLRLLLLLLSPINDERRNVQQEEQVSKEQSDAATIQFSTTPCHSVVCLHQLLTPIGRPWFCCVKRCWRCHTLTIDGILSFCAPPGVRRGVGQLLGISTQCHCPRWATSSCLLTRKRTCALLHNNLLPPLLLPCK